MSENAFKKELSNPALRYSRFMKLLGCRVDCQGSEMTGLLVSKLSMILPVHSDEFIKTKAFVQAFHENGWDQFIKKVYRQYVLDHTEYVKFQFAKSIANPQELPQLDSVKLSKGLVFNIAVRLPFRAKALMAQPTFSAMLTGILLKNIPKDLFELFKDKLEAAVAEYIEECVEVMEIEVNIKVEKEADGGSSSISPVVYGEALVQISTEALIDTFRQFRIYYELI